MSTKKSKKQKNEHAGQKSDVLVLPPDLLEKLGINLENIQSPQHSLIEINAGTSSKTNKFLRSQSSKLNTEKKCIQSHETDSSILETASLMKASVFLSPTFSSLKGDISLNADSNNSEICDEDNIVKSAKIVKSDKQIEHFKNNVEFKPENWKYDVNSPINSNKESTGESEMQSNSVNLGYKNIDVKQSIKSLEEKNEKITTPKAVMETNTKKKEELLKSDSIKDLKNNELCYKTSIVPAKFDPTILIDDKLGKKNKSKPSNIEDQSKDHLEEDNFIITKKQHIEKIKGEKYCSISNCSSKEFGSKLDEIHIASGFNNVNCKVTEIVKGELDSNLIKCSSHDENLKLDSGLIEKNIIAQHNPKKQTISKKINGDLYLSTDSEYKKDIQNKPSSATSIDELNSYDSHEDQYDTKQIGYTNNNLDEGQMTKNKHSIFAQNPVNTSQHSIYNTDSRTFKSNIPLAKVEEIAFYLSQHRQNSMTKNINTVQSSHNSKLCIQGVEKPGGDMKSIHLNRNIKTYSGRKNTKLLNTYSGPLSYLEHIEGSEIDYKIKDNILYSCIKGLHNYCLCDDFGSFFHYDLDKNYEHIHFWEQKEAQCSVETLLSIYEDNILRDECNECNTFSNLEIDDEIQDISVDTTINICWNSIEYIHGQKNLEHEPKNIQNINNLEYAFNTIEQFDKVKTPLLKGKRKRVVETSESETESDKPSAKKTTVAFECGVCNNMISKNEWDSHISKEHCFIAWRTGHDIDMKNKDLFTKLNERLCDAKKLMCTFCDLELYNVKKFIEHVSKCKEEKNEEKASKHSEIVIKVPTANVKSQKEQIIEEPVPDIKCERKQINKFRKGQKIEVEVSGKQFIGKHVLQLETGPEQEAEATILQVVTGEHQEIELPLLPLVQTRQNQEAELSVIQSIEIAENREAEVSVFEQVETRQLQVAELHLPSAEIEKKQNVDVPAGQRQAPETLALKLVKTEHKQAANVPELEVEIGCNEESEVPVLQVETGEKNVTCGVCKTIVRESLWIKHITEEHNYIAWKDDETPLDCENEECIRHYLNNIIKEIGELVCKNCGLKRKFAKSYLKHIKNCQTMEQLDDQVLEQSVPPVAIKTEKIDSDNKRKARKSRTYDVDTDDEVSLANIKKEKLEKTGKESKTSEASNIEKEVSERIVKCGVCKLELSSHQWVDHIFKEHDYMAWQEGEPEIDVNDSQQVYDHLFHVTKQNDGLTCKKCGLTRRYVKSYLKHIQTCEGDTDNLNSTLGSENESIVRISNIDTLILDLCDEEKATCGVCKMDVEAKQWFNHVHKRHAYLAWKEGKLALDLDNELEVQEYLYFVSKKFNGLKCNKCGLNRKYVKSYLAHLESCESKLIDPSVLADGISNKDSYVCAICSEKVAPNEWTNHAMNMHYNIAWVVGDYPVDLKNTGVVEKLLKVYQKQHGTFKCRTCGTKRVSPMGFYVHIIQCGKTEEEIDKFKIFCDICNTKYLCFYKSNHATMHRGQESKLTPLKTEGAQDDESMDFPKTEQLSERRRAAQKALKFIEKSETFAYSCPKCGYGADDEAELAEHACAKAKYRDYSESEDSARPESSDGSSDESADSAADSSLSEHEHESERRRRSRVDTVAAKVPRIPFTIKCPKTYLKQSAEEYCKTFLTNDTLYPQWRSCKIDLVAEDQIASYLPPLKVSCSVIIGKSDPVTYKLFEAKKQNGYSVFVGGCIQSIAWAPPHLDDRSDFFGNFLAVACHSDADVPRLDFTKTYEGSALLQLWDFGDLSSTYPKFALGIAHDYGTVWAIDWCPSGTRDVPPLDDDNESISTSDSFLRLGLLAVACSNGSAYIFSVPYPSSVQTSDKNVFKLTPVAELRLSRGKREPCQATSISWSSQKGHAIILVGYSSGSTALYNLDCDSPLLMENEGGVSIFYPFLDERPHNSCITDVKTFPSSVGGGLVSSVSPTGGQAARRGGAALAHRHLSSAAAAFAPHWPALMLTGNELIVNQAVNELEPWGAGRRAGAVQRACGCVRCARMALYAPPVLKLLTTHPAHTDFNKEPIATFDMTPLSRKRTKQKNDELQVKLEPLTYHDAVKLYALDFQLIKNPAKRIKCPKEHYPERFPLSDVRSMAFYPSQKHHRKLAVATHAGVIFILTVDAA